MDYEYLPHTSEAKFRAYGDSQEKRFANAAKAMFDIMFEIDEAQPKIRKKLIIKGRDARSLLHNWLEELLLLLDSELFVLKDVTKIKINTVKDIWMLEAVILGQKADDLPRRGPEVKAVTYDEMEVTDNHVQAVVDV